MEVRISEQRVSAGGGSIYLDNNAPDEPCLILKTNSIAEYEKAIKQNHELLFMAGLLGIVLSGMLSSRQHDDAFKNIAGVPCAGDLMFSLELQLTPIPSSADLRA